MDIPKNTLEDAIRIAKVIEDKNAGNPMPAQEIATAVGFRQAQDWRFQDLLRSANQYGLVTGSGLKAQVAISSFGQDIVAPSNIPRDRVDTFAKVFLENRNYLRSFSGATPTADVVADLPETGTVIEGSAALVKEPRIREYLDTCFVMMPFGSWFDKYYTDVYVPAIKEAGFEPVRADELFTTGSVVEQIWEQIEKATLLLADLSGKNPNVFYELGLAHAARKPVVFTAAQVEDVPFDLRHLRVIIYDVREPEWATLLKKSVTDYLKNATKDPSKSIPHPFRFLPEAESPPIAKKRRV